MNEIKEVVTKITMPQSDDPSPAKKLATEVAGHTRSVSQQDLLVRGNKRIAENALRQESSSSAANPSRVKVMKLQVAGKHSRKKSKLSQLDLSEMRRGQAIEKSRIESVQVLRQGDEKDLMALAGTFVVVATYEGGGVRNLSLGTERELSQAGVPKTVMSYLLEDHEAESDDLACRAVCLHALLNGFVPTLEGCLDAKEVLRTVGTSRARKAADKIVVMLSSESAAEFLDHFLNIWRNANAADIEMVTVPALTVAVQQDRLAVARVLLRHGADPLLDRVNVADKWETVLTPWKRVFFQHLAPGSQRFGSKEMEELLRASILSSGRQPPTY